MDRKALKQRGKKLFGGNELFKAKYWQSVIVTLFMLFNFGTFVGTKFEFNFEPQSVSDIVASYKDATVTTERFLDIFAGGMSFAVILSSIFSLLLTVLVICTFKAGGIRYYLKSRKNNPADFKEVFQNFKDKTFLNIGKISFCKFGFTYLWSLLFVIPGVIKSYEYWAIDYIVATRPDIERQEAFRLSKILMSGHKWELFVLHLSFFGWEILNGFTNGFLGIFYLKPYEQATYVEFFSDIRLEALAKGSITPFDVPDYEYFAPEYQAPFNPQPFAQQYDNSANVQNYGGFAQPNQQYNPQYNPQPFAQPNPSFNPQYNQQPFSQPVTPQAPSEAPQSTVEAPIEANFEPVTPEETEE